MPTLRSGVLALQACTLSASIRTANLPTVMTILEGVRLEKKQVRSEFRLPKGVSA